MSSIVRVQVVWETSCSRMQVGLECIRCIDRKTGELRGSVLQGVGDVGETGEVAINVKRVGRLLWWLLRDQEGSHQSNGRLSDIAKLEIKL